MAVSVHLNTQIVLQICVQKNILVRVCAYLLDRRLNNVPKLWCVGKKRGVCVCVCTFYTHTVTGIGSDRQEVSEAAG